MNLDISSLSDKELAQMLRDLGENPGPIMKTTRKVHEKKLERLLTEKPHTNGSTPVEFSDEDDEVEDEEVEEEEEEEPEPEPEPEYATIIPVRPNRRLIEAREEKRDVRPRLNRDMVDTPTIFHSDSARLRMRPEVPSVPTQSSYKATTVTSSYSTHSDTASLYPSLVTQEKPVVKAAKPKKHGLSICAQIAIFVVVALFIWLVIQNMDPASKGPPAISV